MLTPKKIGILFVQNLLISLSKHLGIFNQIYLCRTFFFLLKHNVIIIIIIIIISTVL